MKWRAHEADGRIAAKNALKIRGALRQAANWQRIFENYKRTQPAVTNNPTQDRARARAWAILNIYFDNEPLLAVLRRTWADGFALGILSAEDAIRQARELKKADDPDYIDWANWKPGDAAAALLVKPTRAFEALLETAGVTIRGIDRTGYDRLGTALSDAIALGLSGSRAAKLIQDSVSDPARALTIAITETNRAISRATIERYRNYGLEQMEWVTSNPCDLCVQNEGVVVNVGQAFPSGNTQPPAHPNCRCALLPVVPDFEAPGEIDNIIAPIAGPDYYGMTLLDKPEAKKLEQYQQERNPDFSIHSNLPTYQMKQGLEAYKGADYVSINSYLREPRFYANSLSVPEQDSLMFNIAGIDKVMDLAPRVTEPFVTLRGVAGPAAERLSTLTPGTIFVDDAFVSTTLNRDVAEKFYVMFEKNLTIEIVNTPGTKGIMLDKFLDTAQNEMEWLLARGTKFEVLQNTGEVMKVKVIP